MRSNDVYIMETMSKNLLNNLNIMKKENLNKNKVIESFEKDPRKPIYIIDDTGVLLGIITLSSFAREHNNFDNWLNTKFKYVINSDNEIEQAEKLFKENNSIHTIPVLSNEKKLLYEYYYIKEIKNDANYLFDMNEDMKYDLQDFLFDNNYKKVVIHGKYSDINFLYNKLKTYNDIQVVYLANNTDRELCDDIKLIQYDEITDYNADLIICVYESELKLLRCKLNCVENTDIMLLSDLCKRRSFMIKITDIATDLQSKGVDFYYFELPVRKKIKNLTQDEIDRFNKRISLNTLLKDPILNLDLIKKLVPAEYTIDDVEEIVQRPPSISRGEIVINSDFSSKYINVIDGKRVTCENPINYDNKIHVFGPCTAFGVYVEDKYTIESFLQSLLNNNQTHKYKVINHGVYGLERSFNEDYLSDIDLVAGDIVINLDRISVRTKSNNNKFFSRNNVKFYELSGDFDRPHDFGECFIEIPEHTTYIGNKVIANRIYEVINSSIGKSYINLNNISQHFFQGISEKVDKYTNKDQFEQYLQNIKKIITIGSIVMNCNPFTLGHRYLIEQAVNQVDILIIFVVEENKSYFKFEDRIKLVRLGTQDLKNVFVVPSGKFIISTITFPEYFNKDDLQEVKIDMSTDIRIFGEYIAPSINITKRFIGEEPLDYVTRQYNETLKELLPKYGIEVIEIPRKEMDSQVISASSVRRLLTNKDLEQIKKIVPITTYDYLIKNYETLELSNKSF